MKKILQIKIKSEPKVIKFKIIKDTLNIQKKDQNNQKIKKRINTPFQLINNFIRPKTCKLNSINDKINTVKNSIIKIKAKINSKTKKQAEVKKEIKILDEKIKTENQSEIEQKDQIDILEKNIDDLMKQIEDTKKEIEIKKKETEQNQYEQGSMQTINRELIDNFISGFLDNNPEYPNLDNMTYEQILALEEKIGNVSKGLKTEEINLLQVDKYDSKKYEDEKCIICQYEFKESDNIKILECHHIFHIECLDEWLKIQKICPFCKSEI